MSTDPKSEDLERLIRLMGMTQSMHEGEVLNAIKLANRWLEAKGRNWDELLRGKVTVEADPFQIPRSQTTYDKQQTANGPRTPSYRAPPPPSPPPPPPPPPRYYSDVNEINGYFADLEFVTLPSQTQADITVLENRWRATKQLISTDYNVLLRIHSTYAPKRRKRRSRP